MASRRQWVEDLQEKIRFEGRIFSVQVRSTVWRYRIDNRTHRSVGYNLFLVGTAGTKDDAPEERAFSVAISEKQQAAFQFHIGDQLKGTAWTKLHPEREYADYYRAGALKKTPAGELPADDAPPPWLSEVPDLATYNDRGARMLDVRCYKAGCFQCKWAAMSNVTIEYDFGVTQKHRFESFCYGPKSCKLYRMGRARAVPYKGKGSVLDEGWLDEMFTEHRDPDD